VLKQDAMRDINMLKQSCNVDYDDAADLEMDFGFCATSPVAEGQFASSEVAVYGGDEDLEADLRRSTRVPNRLLTSRLLASRHTRAGRCYRLFTRNGRLHLRSVSTLVDR
jgi:hypothetical protein